MAVQSVPLASALSAAGATRRAEWQALLSQREPEKREANPNVANYEKRPEPLTFQHALSVKGSMERTQVAPDLKLELFASEPDITKPIALAWDDRGRCWVCETSDYPQLEFGAFTPLENVEIFAARQDEAATLLETEPDVSSYEPPAPVKSARPPAKQARR